jgi:acetyl-CoA carboxylase biotin carboxyl carrier protein
MKAPRDKKSPRPAGLAAPGVPGVDVAQLEKLLDFMAAHGLEEFEYEHEGLHIRLRKASPDSASASRAQAPARKSSSRPAAAAASSGAESAPASGSPEAAHEGAGAAAAGEDLHVVKSPIVGTFYASPSPEAPPFVNEGDTIRAGQVVCIVEAMKLMNEIEADVGGEVVRVLVENKQPVEYGQPLFSIRPAKKKK